MVSASLEESRISSPIATVICVERLLVVGGERWEGGKGELTSLSILTLALMPSTSASFWFSSSERTASLYWPLCGLEHLSVAVLTSSYFPIQKHVATH